MNNDISAAREKVLHEMANSKLESVEASLVSKVGSTTSESTDAVSLTASELAYKEELVKLDDKEKVVERLVEVVRWLLQSISEEVGEWNSLLLTWEEDLYDQSNAIAKIVRGELGRLDGQSELVRLAIPDEESLPKRLEMVKQLETIENEVHVLHGYLEEMGFEVPAHHLGSPGLGSHSSFEDIEADLEASFEDVSSGKGRIVRSRSSEGDLEGDRSFLLLSASGTGPTVSRASTPEAN